MLSIERSGGLVKLSGEASIHEVEKLYSTLAAVVPEASQGIHINIESLTELDAASAQVLLAFRRRCPMARIEGCPQGLRERLGQTGLAGILLQ